MPFSGRQARSTTIRLCSPAHRITGFSPSFEDAQWMARRISQLQPQDFQDVVAFADYPKRCGHARGAKTHRSPQIAFDKLFALNVRDLPVNLKITDTAADSVLHNGQLTEGLPWTGAMARCSAVNTQPTQFRPRRFSHFCARVFIARCLRPV